ncbi:MAG: hypothetical protein KJO67_09385 [Silicimonas sp.]|nr:hypothetical protein [Silicimonas sp.]NND22877.1 hypothetical protein [Silicimonas sp.]NNL34423.1 hypothetical protein [Silicimonas sp.]RZW12389.1 MAG: hypothetical protein EX266_01595 [Paracoccaceae bacterium]
MSKLPSPIRSFCRRQDGALTSYGLFLVIAMICVGGLAIDVSNAVKVRTHLQVAADSAAHAALVAREYKTETESKTIAVNVAQNSLPTSHFGDSINAGDITFGTWDAATQTFTAVANSNDAVLVNTQRLQGRANGVTTYFLRFVGLNNLDVRSHSVFETYYPTCFREGFVAEQRVDVQSNNTYGNGFCIHSNDHVEINNGNTFMSGTIVSMPNKADIVVPNSDPTANPGLASALRSGSYHVRILDRINDIIAGVEDPNSPYFRTDYVDIDPLTGNPVNRVTLNGNGPGVRLSDWVPGAVHELTCNSPSKKVNFGSPSDIFDKGVVVTNCILQFASVELRDVIVINTNTDANSFKASSGLTVGRDDGCSAGGGAQLVTLGGMNFPSDLQIYGGQLIAAKTISFAARPDGIEGVSIVSGEQIDGSSLINVGFCGGAGMANNFMAEYFRLAT